LGVAVADQERKEPIRSPRGLLGGPRAVRVCGHAEDVHVPGGHLHDEQYVQALEEDRVHMKEIAGRQVHNLIGRNVVELIDLPSGQPGRPSRAMTQAQASRVLKAASGKTSGFIKVVKASKAGTARPTRRQRPAS
jgi:hypothetical protein